MTRLAVELQDTTAHLDGFLVEELSHDRLTGHDGSDATAAAAVLTARGALEEARAAAGQMAALLGQAELAMLALAPTAARAPGGS